jgi:hypothetical protein
MTHPSLWGASTGSMSTGLQFPESASDLHAAPLVLVDQPAEDSAAPYLRCGEIGDDGRSEIGSGWRAEVPGSVRAMLVVMHGVLVHDHVRVPGPAISIRSVTSARAVRTQRPASAFAAGSAAGS